MATADRRAFAFATHPWLPLALAWGAALALLAWEDPLVGVLSALGFAGAFLSGLVGVGGAIVMIPLLLYVPPLLGLPALGMRTVTGITIVQVAVAALSGLAGHSRAVNGPLFVSVGLSMIGASFLGGLASAVAAPEVLEAVFATLALAAALMMLLLRERVVPPVDGQLSFNRALALFVGGSVGFLAGLVGAGGAFILIPLMLHVLRIPLRVVVGTSLAIVAAAALAGLAGKALTGQVDWLLALGLVVGALPGGRLGSYVSHRTRVSWLATILGLVIAFVAARIWLEILA
jgi:uncharacterized membrane protein YfcA